MKNTKTTIELPVMSRAIPLTDVARERGNQEIINQILHEQEIREKLTMTRFGYAPIIKELKERGHKVVLSKNRGNSIKVLPDFKYRTDPNTGKSYIAFEVR